MYPRLLDFLRCPECGADLRLETLAQNEAHPGEVSEGLLHCEDDHWYPVVRGVARMLPDSLVEHWKELEGHVPASPSEPVRRLAARVGGPTASEYDLRTRANFSLEWEQHEPGDRTWGMDVDDRVKWFFLDPLRIPAEELNGKVMLDAGCGNGSQSVAYTRLGLEVVAVDLSSGLQRGQAFARQLPDARPDRVHFLQADLQRPPLVPESFNIIHSAGVLHHTPDTERTFRGLCSLLKPGGTFYVWFYKYEPVVTPVVNTLRGLTTRLPATAFAHVARTLAIPFILFCRTLDALGVRSYSPMSRREATLALMDIFGAPHAHHHSYPEVCEWYRSEDFEEIWACNDGRRGFGVCGRKAGASSTPGGLHVGDAIKVPTSG